MRNGELYSARPAQQNDRPRGTLLAVLILVCAPTCVLHARNAPAEPYRLYPGSPRDPSQVAHLRPAVGVTIFSINGGEPPPGGIEALPGRHVLTVLRADRGTFLRFEAEAGHNYQVEFGRVVDSGSGSRVSEMLETRDVGWAFFLMDASGNYSAPSGGGTVVTAGEGRRKQTYTCAYEAQIHGSPDFGYEAENPMWQTYGMGLLIRDEHGKPVDGQQVPLGTSGSPGFVRDPAGHYYALEGHDLLQTQDALYAVDDSGHVSDLLRMQAPEIEALQGPLRELARQLAVADRLDKVRLHFATANGGPLVGWIEARAKGPGKKQKITIQVGSPQ